MSLQGERNFSPRLSRPNPRPGDLHLPHNQRTHAQPSPPVPAAPNVIPRTREPHYHRIIQEP
ncbi:DUF2241 superfamily domain-containing protein [Histoplasma ohiense]|nr:DUF2241 superfamily domain-containing protein [Histoplasma ohiense (nom. inval.)]